MEKEVKKCTNGGITLVALVITIIVLLILSGVTISLTLGDNGLINRTQEARNIYTNAQENELAYLNELYSSIKVATDDNAEITISMKDLKTYIQSEVNDALKTEDITSNIHLNTEYVSNRMTPRMSKSGNTIVLSLYLNILKDIPAGTPLATIDELYCPKISIIEKALLNSTRSKNININGNGFIGFLGETISDSSIITINVVWQI